MQNCYVHLALLAFKLCEDKEGKYVAPEAGACLINEIKCEVVRKKLFPPNGTVRPDNFGSAEPTQ